MFKTLGDKKVKFQTEDEGQQLLQQQLMDRGDSGASSSTIGNKMSFNKSSPSNKDKEATETFL